MSKIGKIKKLPEFREVFYGSFEGGSIDDIWLGVSKAAGIPATTDVKKIIDTIGIYKFREVTKKADPLHLAESTEELETRMCRAIKVLRKRTSGEGRVLLVSPTGTLSRPWGSSTGRKTTACMTSPSRTTAASAGGIWTRKAILKLSTTTARLKIYEQGDRVEDEVGYAHFYARFAGDRGPVGICPGL
ncbi:MAG: hypothetical protein V8S74_07905 [Lachnospirales bacterium]